MIEEFHPAKIGYLSSRCFSSLYILRKFDGFVIDSNNDQWKQIAQKDNLCLFFTGGIFLSSQKISLHLFYFYKQFLLILPQYTKYQQTIGKNNTLLNDIFFCFQFTCHFPSWKFSFKTFSRVFSTRPRQLIYGQSQNMKKKQIMKLSK